MIPRLPFISLIFNKLIWSDKNSNGKNSNGYLALDSEGRLDPKFLDAENMTAVSMVPSIPLPGESPNIIRARDKFAQKRFKNEFTWSPTPELEQAICNKALK
jgi:hypothetical protein